MTAYKIKEVCGRPLSHSEIQTLNELISLQLFSTEMILSVISSHGLDFLNKKSSNIRFVKNAVDYYCKQKKYEEAKSRLQIILNEAKELDKIIKEHEGE